MFSKFKTAVCISATLIVLGASALYVKATVPAAAPQADAPVVIKMTAEHKFMPEKVTIKSGQTVQWLNDEPNGMHEVTTDPDIAVDPKDVSIPDGAQTFDSKMIKTGKTYSHQFTTPGVYKYTCPPHEDSGMSGEITVTK